MEDWGRCRVALDMRQVSDTSTRHSLYRGLLHLRRSSRFHHMVYLQCDQTIQGGRMRKKIGWAIMCSPVVVGFGLGCWFDHDFAIALGLVLAIAGWIGLGSYLAYD